MAIPARPDPSNIAQPQILRSARLPQEADREDGELESADGAIEKDVKVVVEGEGPLDYE